MVTLFTLISILAAFVATLISVKAFPRWARTWQMVMNEWDRRRLLRIAEKADRQFEANIQPQLVGNDFATGRLWVLFKSREISVPMFDDIHQRSRSIHGLPPYSLQRPPGILNAERINASHNEIQWEIEDAGIRGVRDVSLLIMILYTISVISGLAAFFLT